MTLAYQSGKIDSSYFQKIVGICDKISNTNPNKITLLKLLQRIDVDKLTVYKGKMEEDIEYITSDIFEKEERFPLKCNLKPFSQREIPVLWNYKKSHKTVLLCLHGLGEDKNSSVFSALMKRLDAEGCGVVCFDWPAHGDSKAKDADLTVENCLNDLDQVVRFLKQLKNDYICCFATGYGGYISTLYRNTHDY